MKGKKMSKFHIELLPGARRYLKSIRKDRSLLQKYKVIIETIQHNPLKGKENKGDLAGIYTIDFRHQKTVYELAYVLTQQHNKNTLIIILAGTRENFYRELKRYIKTL